MFRGNEFNIKTFKHTRFQSRYMYGQETRELIANTEFYSDPSLLKLSECEPRANIEFIAGGSASTAYTLVSDGGKVAVLNFADAIIPGGCVDYGAPTQEENLCRCTNLYESLAECVEYYYYNSLARDEVYTNGVIYSPNVTCFKDDVDYKSIDARQFDVMTCPSPATKVESGVIISRIEGIIKTAVLHKVDTIVLGAWGCGAFCQDPLMMGRYFAEVLNKYNYFKKVVFAIRPSSEGWREDNMWWFERGFTAVYEG